MNAKCYAILRTADGLERFETNIRTCMAVRRPIIPPLKTVPDDGELEGPQPCFRYREYVLVDVIEVPIFEERVEK
jgi:hypothetical protein